MMESAPAETYCLNRAACSIGRLAIPQLDNQTAYQNRQLLETSLEQLQSGNLPPVPIAEPELLRQAIDFDKRLIMQIQTGPANRVLTDREVKYTGQVISNHQQRCEAWMAVSKPELLSDINDVAGGFGLLEMWDDAPSVVEGEVARWGYDTRHPAIPDELAKSVSRSETKELIRFMANAVIGYNKALPINVRLTTQDNMYHLFWNPINGGLDYVTPRSYDRATQLSFDLPHNAAHLIHLHEASGRGVDYDDSMGQRAYFEAVAVLSEFAIVRLLESDSEAAEHLANLFECEEGAISSTDLKDWIIADRAFEFKLRAARLYGDSLMGGGCEFEEAVNEVTHKLGLSHEQASAETRKYLPWTGLGSVYTLGYRKLLKSAEQGVIGAILDDSGRTITTWEQTEVKLNPDQQ